MSLTTIAELAPAVDQNEDQQDQDYPFPMCETSEQFYAFMRSLLNNVQVKSRGMHKKTQKHEFEVQWTSKVLKETYTARGMNTDIEKAAIQSVHNMLQGTFFPSFG